MPATPLRIPVENPEELLNASSLGAGALGRVERSATGGGAGFSEVGTFALVSTTRMYLFFDLAGADGSFYRVRFSTSAGGSFTAYQPEFQAPADDTGAYLCSILDVEQRMGEQSDEELLFDIIKEVSDDFEDYCNAWLAPRPTYNLGTTTLLFDVKCNGYEVPLVYGGRYTGIRSFTSVGVAVVDQPATGGTYTTATASQVIIRPQPSENRQGLRLRFLVPSTGPVGMFYAGQNTVTVTGSFGPATVAPRIQSAAIEAVIRKYIGKTQKGVLIPSLSPDARAVLARDRMEPVG